MGAGLRLELKSVDNGSTMLPLHQPAKKPTYFAFYFMSFSHFRHISRSWLRAGGSLMGQSMSTTRSLNYLPTLSGRQTQIFGFLSLREVLTSFMASTS